MKAQTREELLRRAMESRPKFVAIANDRSLRPGNVSSRAMYISGLLWPHCLGVDGYRWPVDDEQLWLARHQYHGAVMMAEQPDDDAWLSYLKETVDALLAHHRRIAAARMERAFIQQEDLY